MSWAKGSKYFPAVHFNSLGEKELCKIPGVGRKLAEQISASLIFSWEELAMIPGVGEMKATQIKEYLQAVNADKFKNFANHGRKLKRMKGKFFNFEDF